MSKERESPTGGEFHGKVGGRPHLAPNRRQIATLPDPDPELDPFLPFLWFRLRQPSGLGLLVSLSWTARSTEVRYVVYSMSRRRSNSPAASPPPRNLGFDGGCMKSYAPAKTKAEDRGESRTGLLLPPYSTVPASTPRSSTRGSTASGRHPQVTTSGASHWEFGMFPGNTTASLAKIAVCP